MTLGEMQRLFTPLIGQLIQWAYANGYELTFGEAYRTDEQSLINAMGPFGRERLALRIRDFNPELASAISNNGRVVGAAQSLHQLRLAVDLNAFKGGIYLPDTDSYEPLGTFWKSLHPLARWGGDFSNPDGNHFSLMYNGRA